MRVIVEQLVEWRLAGETEVLGENLPQRHFVHHKFHMTKCNLFALCCSEFALDCIKTYSS
jgi:hypothetical protein